MVTVGWVALTLLGAALYGVLVYLVSAGSRAGGMQDPATAPVWRVLLAGSTERPEGEEVIEESGLDTYYRAA